MKIIVLTGLTGSGKSSISSPTTKKYDLPILETGDIVYETVKERGLEITPENIKTVSVEAKKISDAFFTEKLVEKARKLYSDKPAICVSGVRAVSEVEFLRKEFGHKNVLVIGFHASQDTRFHRLGNEDRKLHSGAKAAEDAALLNIDDFLAREIKELGFGIGSVFALADIIISNDDKNYPYLTVNHNQFIFEAVVKRFIYS